MNLPGGRIWTVGHSNRTFVDFVALLRAHAIECIADVRRHPGSRAHPHFNADALARSLPQESIAYRAFEDLGGRRVAAPSSHNGAWRNASFRGYADFMETEDFAAALCRLIEHAARQRTAIMCSEAVWWRCHRALISDALKARGHTVIHLMGVHKAVEHPYTGPARVEHGKLSYQASGT